MVTGNELNQARAPTGGLWPRWPGRADWATLSGFLALTVLLFRGAWASPTTTWVGQAGDPPLFMWLLRWTPYALSHGHNPLVTDYINYPDGVNLMWNTAMPLPSLLLSPLTLAAGPVVSYNTLITMAVALSAWTAYLMLRRYVASRSAAILGGLLYGFSPFVLSHAAEHPNLPSAFIPPLVFVLLDEILVRQRRPPVITGLWLGGLAFVQLMVSEELLATEVLVAAIALGLLILLFPRMVRPRAGHAAKALTTALVSSLALSAVPLAVQFFGRQRVRSGALWGPNIFVSDLWSFIVPAGAQQLSPAWARDITQEFTNACCPAELGTYLGLPLIVLMAVVAVWMWRTPLVRFAALLAGIVTVFSLGPRLQVKGDVTSLPLPFEFVTRLPLLKNMLAARLMLYVYLMAAILLAVVLDRLLASRGPSGSSGRRTRWPGPILAATTAAVVLIPLVPHLSFPSTRSPTPSFFRSDQVRRIEEGSVALVAPFARDTNTSGSMLWQAEAGFRFKMPSGYALGPDENGRFSYLPIPTELSRTMERIQQGKGAPALDAHTRRVLADDLAAKQVRSVVVGPMLNRDAMVAFFDELLRRGHEQVGGVELWLGVDPAPLA